MFHRKKFDWGIAILLLILMIFGVVAIFTASSTTIGQQRSTQSFWWKQLIFVGLAIVSIVLLLRLPMPICDALILPLYW